MKHKISKYRIERVLDTEIEIDIPETPEYYFQTGIRRAIAIIPEYTTWNKENYNKEEEIWKLNFICSYQMSDKIEVFEVQLSQLTQSCLANAEKYDSIYYFFLNRENYGKRSKDQFMSDYNRVIDKINENLENKRIL